ncbi:hypothetical protein GGTG_10528 [Gaeumannomyces tritici R3-111a-1]|uniref:Integral membrane protein n=1 Tax=Gaeumannomyces tritici (strain R3-111a-1) TaxID=644352 RepID=J3PAK3_GAET3|nr:hypothetical protein GGTG_10528 [Gaeumannomyces tritici R3-111a-1]EJT71269.1 hypothetical protein GGTG_10528 [Gaeumannomyces tritici R3-111a-1]
MSPLSQSPLLLWAAYAFGGILTGFGVNAAVRPAHALSFFGLAQPPQTSADRRAFDALVAVYGARDVFMGAAVFAAARNGHASTLGCLLLGIGAVAGIDGLVCRVHGTGEEWGHWGYAPMVAATGALMLGVLD